MSRPKAKSESWQKDIPMTRDPGAIIKGENDVHVCLLLNKLIKTFPVFFRLNPQLENLVSKVEDFRLFLFTHVFIDKDSTESEREIIRFRKEDLK